VALLWWGTNYPARYWWAGGGLLRHDWLAFTIIGICLVKKARPAAGGAALGYATLLRIFPGALVAALVLKVAVESIAARRIVSSPAQRRFAAGCVAAIAVLVSASSVVSDSPVRWLDFLHNSQLHLSTSLTNNMGLKTALAFDPATRGRLVYEGRADEPYGRWKQERRATFERRQGLYVGAVVAFVALLAWRVRSLPDWTALVLGIGLIPITMQLSCYYYAIFLGYGLLYQRGREELAAALCAVSFASCLISFSSSWYDEIFAATSVLVIAFTLWLTASQNSADEQAPHLQQRIAA
jgi:hypothetical protein